jgi:multicomponent Na+:H+ antiporter subunit E
VFVIEVIKSNIDVALRVVKPVIPIKPGIVQVNTKLNSKLARLLLANAITLTPGTITVDIHKDQLFIHWIYIDAEDVDTATKKIVTKFERYLEVIFG